MYTSPVCPTLEFLSLSALSLFVSTSLVYPIQEFLSLSALSLFVSTSLVYPTLEFLPLSALSLFVSISLVCPTLEFLSLSALSLFVSLLFSALPYSFCLYQHCLCLCHFSCLPYLRVSAFISIVFVCVTSLVCPTLEFLSLSALSLFVSLLLSALPYSFCLYQHCLSLCSLLLSALPESFCLYQHCLCLCHFSCLPYLRVSVFISIVFVCVTSLVYPTLEFLSLSTLSLFVSLLLFALP